MKKRRMILNIGELTDAEDKFFCSEVDSAAKNAIDVISIARHEYEEDWWSRFINYCRTGK